MRTSWVDDLIEIYGSHPETSEFPAITEMQAAPTSTKAGKTAPQIVIPRISPATFVVAGVVVACAAVGIGAMIISPESSESIDTTTQMFSCQSQQPDDMKTTDGVFTGFQQALVAGEPVKEFLSEKSPLYDQKWTLSGDPDLIVCVEPILVDPHKLDAETRIFDPSTDSAVVYTQRITFALSDHGPRIREITDLERATDHG